ncbi:MAG TPA: hypothetical protein VLK58_17835 [Conexibacter sp.]|nr:hypothetical protein [Conexibacter sp.]
MAIDRRRTLRGALAGGVAAGLWALQQPLDKRVFASRYDDVELLGRFVTGTRDGWYAPGFAAHAANGALFGAVYTQLAPRLPGPPAARGAQVALLEHLALWPAGRLSDRFHPGRKQLPVLTGSRRAFWQAVWRHALFGVLLGELEARLNRPAPADESAPEPYEHQPSRNGHGNLEHAVRVDSGSPPE